MSESEIKQQCRDNYLALLQQYAHGQLGELENMIVAAHLTLNPKARAIVAEFESIGGDILMNECEPVPMEKCCVKSMLNLIDTDRSDTTSKPFHEIKPSHDDLRCIPSPITQYFDRKNQPIKWKKLSRGIDYCPLPDNQTMSIATLLRAQPNVSMEEHEHTSEEITLLLDGAYEDVTGRHEKGDLIVLDERIPHKPVSDKKHGCVCITLAVKNVKFKRFWIRAAQFLFNR